MSALVARILQALLVVGLLGLGFVAGFALRDVADWVTQFTIVRKVEIQEPAQPSAPELAPETPPSESGWGEPDIIGPGPRTMFPV